MGKIKVLDEDVSSKIAAGEIIEKPVSVVKELIENSIDASAKNIIIEIEQGGKKSIKVIDDGEGMAKEDIKLAFERHATSKIKNTKDIFNIKTLGFRGEALPSIASVSKIIIFSKTKNDLIGIQCRVHAGNIETIKEAPTRNGCFIEVRDLFFNIPARLKFLRSDAREASDIIDLVSKYAIGRPDISFKLINNKKEIFFSSGNGDIREVVAKVYGLETAKKMIYLEKSYDYGKISGYISTPQFNRGNRGGENFFVNGRYIKNIGLSYCLERAYKTLLPIGRFPIAAIFIQIDSSMIDVNVHPAKTEIKFQNENELHKIIYKITHDKLKSHVLIPEEKFNIEQKNIKPLNKETPMVNEDFLKDEYFTDNIEIIDMESISSPPSHNLSIDIFKKTDKLYRNKNNIYEQSFIQKKPIEHRETSTNIKNIIGQLFNTYIIVEGEKKFYLIDQHAAHERILYETYTNQYKQTPASQNLIEPYQLELNTQDMLLINEYIDEINRMGFDVSIFGENTVLIRAVPYFFNRVVEPSVLQVVLDEFKEKEYKGLSPKERFISSMACHTAIKAGELLSVEEIKELVNQLGNLDSPFTCPHGRPTIISMTQYELEKKFKRVQ